MRHPLSGEYGWFFVLGLIAVIDLYATDGQTLSEASYRVRRRHPVLVRAAIIATAYHLLLGDDPSLGRADVFKLSRPVTKYLKPGKTRSVTH